MYTIWIRVVAAGLVIDGAYIYGRSHCNYILIYDIKTGPAIAALYVRVWWPVKLLTKSARG